MGNKNTYTGNTAKEYDGKRFFNYRGSMISRRETDTFLSFFKYIKNKSLAVEFGCGTGRFTELNASDFIEVIATDVSPDMLSIANSKLSPFNNITFINKELSDIHDLVKDADFLYAVRVLNHLESHLYFSNSISTILNNMKNGSVLLLEFANNERPFKLNRPNALRFSVKQIKKIMDLHGFEVKDYKGLFFLSMTAFNLGPKWLLPSINLFDIILSKIMPRLSSRIYILGEKTL